MYSHSVAALSIYTFMSKMIIFNILCKVFLNINAIPPSFLSPSITIFSLPSPPLLPLFTSFLSFPLLSPLRPSLPSLPLLSCLLSSPSFIYFFLLLLGFCTSSIFFLEFCFLFCPPFTWINLTWPSGMELEVSLFEKSPLSPKKHFYGILNMPLL